MLELAAAIEASGLAGFLRASRWTYPAVNALHLLGVALLVGAVAPMDLRLAGLWRRDVPVATVLRLLRAEGLLLEANYQRERRQLAARRKAAFAVEPTGPNQVWQLDFTEFETTVGGTFDGDRSPTPGPAARRPLHL